VLYTPSFDQKSGVQFSMLRLMACPPVSGPGPIHAQRPVEVVTMDQKNKEVLIKGFWGVRYQVKDVARSVAFYSQQLGFAVDQQRLPAFAQVSIGGLKLILSGPGASGSRPMPDGREQEPGGWNRVVLHVKNLSDRIATLEKAGVHFRNTMEVGPGGKQIQIEDPDGNPIELFEPAGREV